MISAIVLAAGISSRMGELKPLLRLSGRPLLAHALESVRRSRVGHVVVVLGAEADRVRREIPLDGATVVVNPEYADGMSTSLRVGLRSAPPDSEGYLIVLGDQPFVSPSTMNALIERRRRDGAKILVPTFRGRRGNPVLVDRSLGAELERVRGDIGCRALFGHHPDELAEVPVEDPGILLDIDTPEQLARIREAVNRGEALESLVEKAISEPAAVRAGEASQRRRSASLPRPDVLSLALELRARNEPFVLATVVRATRPTSGKPGHRALVRPNRDIVGWVGGSCTDSAVLKESMAALEDGRARLLRLTRDPRRSQEEGVVEYYMECHSGGTMDIYLEPNLPRPKLLIVGESPIAEALSGMGRLLGYHVVLAAPKATRDAHPDADDVLDDLERLATAVGRDTSVVVATMGKYDETALRALASSPATYVGLVASRKRASVVLESLRKAGVAPDAVERIRSPAGLDLAAETPEEIALSILAEITQVRRTAPIVEALRAEPAPSPVRASSLDVVCGMEVDPQTPLTALHAGTTYYFCSEGCRARFLESPDAFLR
ncbi:MAG: NTP transferase domain-containing protein [Thermoplasmata archaeon]